MAYHTPSLKKVKKPGEMPLSILSLSSTFFLIGWDRGKHTFLARSAQ